MSNMMSDYELYQYFKKLNPGASDYQISKIANEYKANPSSVTTGAAGTVNIGEGVQLSSALADTSNKNMYYGTKNGAPAMVDQANIQTLDPGSVTTAQVDGTTFNADTPKASSFGTQDYLNMANIATGAIDTGMGIANYFENKKNNERNYGLAKKGFNASALAYNNQVEHNNALRNTIASAGTGKNIVAENNAKTVEYM